MLMTKPLKPTMSRLKSSIVSSRLNLKSSKSTLHTPVTRGFVEVEIAGEGSIVMVTKQKGYLKVESKVGRVGSFDPTFENAEIPFPTISSVAPLTAELFAELSAPKKCRTDLVGRD